MKLQTLRPYYPLLLVIAALLVSGEALAQKNYLITKKGERIVCYGEDVSINGYMVTYENEKGRRKSIKQSKLKEMRVFGRKFINLPVLGNSVHRMHEVLAYNGKYYLTQFYDKVYRLYIFDRKKELTDFKRVVMPNSAKKQQQVVEDIAVYFGNCDELLARLVDNVENLEEFTKGVQNVNCRAKR